MPLKHNPNKISGIRRDYGTLELNENKIKKSPFSQFNFWLEEVLKVEIHDPTAMVLSTVDEQGRPDSRVVLLKGIENNQFIFFSNYKSTKAQEITKNPNVALNFYWPEMARQVRIRGKVDKISSEKSDSYFSERPINSQISAIISHQSQIIPSREFLEEQRANTKTPCTRPDYWGGYALTPFEFEFWQGRNDRLHDRFKFSFENNN